MATTTAGDDVADKADALYQAVSLNSMDEHGARTNHFDQESLLKLGELSTAQDLMPLINFLSRHGLFRTVKLKGKLAWTARPREAAKKIITLDRDEKSIYECIEEAHTDGIWTKDIRRKTQVTATLITKTLGKFEKSNLIRSIKSVKSPIQKTYILAHLTPNEDVTGNSFFDSGDLDESFRDELMNLIVFWVRTQSWAEGGKKKKSRPKAITEDAANDAIVIEDDGDAAGGGGKKRKRDADDDGDDPLTTHARPKFRSTATTLDPETHHSQLIYRSGTHTYPTATAIHKFLTSSDAIKPTKAASLTVPEIQGCIDVLIWDDKLERIQNSDGIEWGYRTVRGVTFKPPGATFDIEEAGKGNALTDAPCGRCPVFDVCEEGGPVNAGECVYFDAWLKA